MNQKDIIKFFDSLATSWDSTTTRNETAISDILDLSQVTQGKEILDIACGTGVLFPDYLKREVKSVLGLDISQKMVEIANNKWQNNKKITVICDDAQRIKLNEKFDVIMIHNAFPHFDEPQRLIANLCEQLKACGRLTVAHSMSKEDINSCHKGRASTVSVELMDENDLAKLMEKYLKVDIVISDNEKYIVSGTKI